MKIIITGVAGFIGSNLAEYFLSKGVEVVGIDNFNDVYDPKIKEYNIKEFQDNLSFKLYRIDLLDAEALSRVFEIEKDAYAVVHLAAWPNVTKSFESPALYVRNNIEATVNVLEMCKKIGPKTFVFASTSSIYGENTTPFVETMSTDRPLAPYPATKKGCEAMIFAYTKYFGINATIVRLFNPNGKRLRPDLALPKLIKSCLYGYEFPIYWDKDGSANTGRDYCSVHHICEAIDNITKKPFKYEIFNLGNSSPVTLDKLISTVEEVTGKKVNLVQKPPRSGEMQVTYANIDKAKEMIGYNPDTPLKKIVEMYYDWFLKQEEWYQHYK